MTTEKKKIHRRDLGIETMRQVRESLQARGRAEGAAIEYTALEREALLLAQVVAVEAIEVQFEELVAKRAGGIVHAVSALATEMGRTVSALQQRVEALEKAAQK